MTSEKEIGYYKNFDSEDVESIYWELQEFKKLVMSILTKQNEEKNEIKKTQRQQKNYLNDLFVEFDKIRGHHR